VTAVQSEELGDEKSMYASSKTSTPFQNDRVFDRKSWIDDGDMSFPVGFPGDVNSNNFIVGCDFRVEIT
jgi:hypothetical protein